MTSNSNTVYYYLAEFIDEDVVLKEVGKFKYNRLASLSIKNDTILICDSQLGNLIYKMKVNEVNFRKKFEISLKMGNY